MRISVALCSYNGAAYIGEQLASISAQTRLPEELLVCDDGSTDSSITEVLNFAAIAPFPVRVIKNDIRLGSTANFSKAIGLCSGDLIVLADQDDLWQMNKLLYMERQFIAQPGTGAIFSNAELIDAASNRLPGSLWQRIGFSLPQQTSLRATCGLGDFFRGNYVTGATLAFRSSLKDAILPIPTHWVHDHWIAFITSIVSRLGCIDEKLIRYRCHAKQQLGINQGVVQKWRKFLEFDPSLYRNAEIMWIDAAQRLEHIDAERYRDAILNCQTMAQHMRLRGLLPQKRYQRLSLMLPEIVNGNYHRYSLGLQSIMHDWLAVNDH